MKTQLCAVLVAFTLACGGTNPTGVSPATDSGRVDAGTPNEAGVPDGGPVQISVSGTLVGLRGIPAASITLSISGQSPLNTDAAGHFSFSQVTVPYDVVVVDNPYHTAIVYKGLTRSDPTLFYGGYNAGIQHTATLQGQISQIDPNPTANEAGLVGFAAPERNMLAATDASGNYGFSADWQGSESIVGTFFGLQYTVANGMVTAYKGFASKQVTLSADGTFSENMAMVPVTNANISGTVSLAPGYTLQATSNFLTLHGLPAVGFSDASGSNAFTYVTPNVPDFKILMEAKAPLAGTQRSRRSSQPG